MIGQKAYASFLKINGTHGTEYRINLNKTAARLLEGVKKVDIGKSENYIVLFPVAEHSAFGLNVSTINNNPSLAMTRLVKHYGFIPKELFDSTRYAVKRGKVGDNRVFICLKEVVTYDD